MPSGSNPDVALPETCNYKAINPVSATGLTPCKREHASQSTSAWSKKLNNNGVIMVDLDIDSEDQTGKIATTKVKKEPTSTSAPVASRSSWERPMISTPLAVIDLDDKGTDVPNPSDVVDDTRLSADPSFNKTTPKAEHVAK